MFTPAAAAADVQPPSTPGTPVVTNMTTVSVTLTWAPSTSEAAVTGYDVFRAPGSASNVAQVGTTAGNSFTDTGLSPGTVYRYQVRARDAAGNVSAFSPIAFAMTAGPCTTPPPAPGNLTILAIGATTVSLRWGIVVPSYGCSPAGFDVLRAPGTSGGTFTPIAQTGFVDTFADTTVSPNTTYRYQVRARSANGLVSGPSNIVQATTPDSCTPPLPLGSLTVTAVGTSSVSLSWAGPTNPACIAYDILRAPGTSGGTFTLVGTTSSLSLTNTGMTLNTTYRYMVQGRNLATGAVWGATNDVLATTSQGCTLVPPPVPGNLTATGSTATSVHAVAAVSRIDQISRPASAAPSSGLRGRVLEDVMP
ncbi:fibronectin type III domain-containing protein [Catellatospora citrea]|uniref:fibronectin type III domain-containing protein n=1 Tax=Catellatospora citrea TaxID=53366 RepID=UPI0033D321B3